MNGRFAPSPTGPLHIGNALTAYFACQRARDCAFVLRMEDLDTPRVVAGCEAEQLEDLRWLGIRWTEFYRQSERLEHYESAVQTLLGAGHAYYCTCSRKQIALASAPHGPEGPRYPGTCRGRNDKPAEPFAVRFEVPDRAVTFTDTLFGEQRQNVDAFCGDFVIARADGVYAYQLAVVVDDIAMRVEEVVRGADLLASTPRQILLYEALRAKTPVFTHVPLVTCSGEKLSKREPRHTLAGLRALCVKPESLRRRFDDALATAVASPALDIGSFV